MGMAGPSIFKDGLKQAYTTAGSTTDARDMYIGQYNNNGTPGAPWGGNILAIVAFSVTLTDAQMQALTLAMQRL